MTSDTLLGPRMMVQVGDRICRNTWKGDDWFEVWRVTARFAMAVVDGEEKKFPRIIPEAGMRPSGKHDLWDTTKYTVWRKK
jgi:hypothetical protein